LGIIGNRFLKGSLGDDVRVPRWIIVAAVVAVGLVAGARYVVRHAIPVSFDYCVEARFETLPAADKPLADWLRGQPGVVAQTVCISREGPDGKLIKIGFVQSHTLSGQPTFPDLEAASRTFGYTGSDSPFRDCADRFALQRCCD
jgi:hypothetical protein